MRPGLRLTLIDVSACGALVEAARQLRPGSFVDVQLETDARHGTIAARVVRCAVAAIHAECGVTYRAALSFTHACEWVREALTPRGYGIHAPATGAGSPSPACGERLPAMRDDRLKSAVKGTK